MPAPADMQTWFYASIAEHIHNLVTAELVIDFLDTRSDAWDSATTKAEVTISGPRSREVTKGCHRSHVDVFVRVTSHMSSNNYGHLTTVGEIVNALDRCILIYSYPTPGELVDEITPRSETNDEINVTHLQPAEKDTQIHSTIEARYVGYLEA